MIANLFASNSGASKPVRIKDAEMPANFKRKAAMPLCGGAPQELIPFRVKQSPYDANALLRAAAVSGSLAAKSASANAPGTSRRRAPPTDVAGPTVVVNSDTAPPARDDDNEGRGEEQEEEQEEEEVERRRRLLHRTIGWTIMGVGCGKEKMVRVPHENDGVGPSVKKNVRGPKEEALVRCLTNIEACTFNDARAAATQLPFYKLFHRVKSEIHQTGLKRRYNSCALVGNAGHLSKEKWGEYIDNHDVVVRFNNLPNLPYSAHVGNRTSIRIVNHRRSLASCCRGNFPEGRIAGSRTAILVWFPAAQREILDQCKRRFPNNPGLAMRPAANKAMVSVMKQAREDLSRLGFGPYGQWRQMTSGAHAVLLYTALCDSVSLYGFTTYGKGKDGGADQYTAALGGRDNGSKVGQVVKARSGQRWHDWTGESVVWRLFHASGLTPICSS